MTASRARWRVTRLAVPTYPNSSRSKLREQLSISNEGFDVRAVCGRACSGNSDARVSVVEEQAVTPEPIGRDWGEIGLGLASAFALVGIGSVGIWAVIVLVGALA